MSIANRLLLAITVLALLVSHPSLSVADDGSGCDEGIALQTSLMTLNDSGVTGSAKV